MDEETARRPEYVRGAPHSRFTPGTMVADRYRIVALLGKGGMGEVYRADDVKLGQHVALKYIPREIAQNASALERFYSEARIGRQIAHPNLCRVYDIVEANGQRFIAMEYVDGEDLASLLRRIGRLPADTALRLSRDLCSGLAAAHDRGILHRDLKPANIMIDGMGRARITDFGLAVFAAEAQSELAGTAAYMSPEQLNGAPATARGDLYALGLVMFEMFTGRPVFEPDTWAGIREQHARAKTAPSVLVREIDPVVERLILRCIEEEPRARPSFAHEILAALPGGDPLDAVVAAGETPSPEMVEAANRVGDLDPRRAWVLLASLFALLAVALFAGERALLTWFAPDVQSPDAQMDRARTVMRVFGYDERAVDRHGRYFIDYPLLRSAYERGGTAVLPEAGAWARQFRYRDAPSPLVPKNVKGRINDDDPPFVASGMTAVRLDGEGRLREFRRVASPQAAAAAPVSVDWNAAFREAALDPGRFRAVPPSAVSPVGAERTYAWEGSADGIPIHVDAATVGSRAVWFAVQPPWRPSPGGGIRPSDTGVGWTLLYVSGIVAGVILGRRNVLRGRADLRGARRLAWFAAVMQFGALVCRADHTPVLLEEWQMLTGLAGSSLFFAVLVWLCHITVEPYVRRRWPHMLVSSKRLMSGRLRDPLVGTDVLWGLIAGTCGTGVLFIAEALLIRRGLYVPLEQSMGAPPTKPLGFALLFFDGWSRALVGALLTLIVVVLARLIVRSDTGAFVVAWIVVSIAADDMGGSFLVDCMIRSLLVAPQIFVARRHGVLALLASLTTMLLLGYTPLTSDLSRWYGRFSAGVLLVIAAAGVYAFRIALAGKPLFGNVLAEDEAAA